MSRPTILVVDDDADIRSVLADVLRDERYTVVEAADGAEALTLMGAMATQPALILLDLMMPQVDGWEFRRRQLLDPKLASTPVVIISAFAPTDSSSRDLFAKTTRLRKPVDLDSLLHVVRSHVP
jgi:CheY-like chemotaxis protein